LASTFWRRHFGVDGFSITNGGEEIKRRRRVVEIFLKKKPLGDPNGLLFKRLEGERSRERSNDGASRERR